jgi:hypothetical protein
MPLRGQARYYQVFLGQDLFGDWALITVWGGIGSNRRRMHSTGVASYKSGVEQIREIVKRGAQHGYRESPLEHLAAVSGLSDWPEASCSAEEGNILNTFGAQR